MRWPNSDQIILAVLDFTAISTRQNPQSILIRIRLLMSTTQSSWHLTGFRAKISGDLGDIMLKYSLTHQWIPAKSHTSLGETSVTTREIAGITAQIVKVIQYSALGCRHVDGAVISNRLVTLNNNLIRYAQGLASVTDSQGTTQWYHNSHNISSSIQAWLDHLGYTWPLTKDQQAHFILTFV